MRQTNHIDPVLHGFTLVELLVVIGIIALLISILMPSLNRARQSALKVQCASNQRQIGLAFIQYANDNKGALPCFVEKDTSFTYDPITNRLWNEVIAPYVGVKNAADAAHNTGEREVAVRYMNCPVDSGGAEASAFGVNYSVVFKYPPNTDKSSLKLSRVPARTFMLVDAASYWIYNPGPLQWPATVDTDGDGYPDSHTAFVSPPVYNFNLARPKRHNGSANYLFADGHVESLSVVQWETNEGNIWGSP